LHHLEGPELETLRWMYHKDRRRVRANQQWHEFASLVRMGTLQVEDEKLPYNDRFFVMPDYIHEALVDRWGARTEGKLGDEPPWTKRPPGWIA
jgi:hypothetical protein